jgi:hypothetical protein
MSTKHPEHPAPGTYVRQDWPTEDLTTPPFTLTPEEIQVREFLTELRSQTAEMKAQTKHLKSIRSNVFLIALIISAPILIGLTLWFLWLLGYAQRDPSPTFDRQPFRDSQQSVERGFLDPAGPLRASSVVI